MNFILTAFLLNADMPDTTKLIESFQKIELECSKLTSHTFLVESHYKQQSQKLGTRSVDRYLRISLCGDDHIVSEFRNAKFEQGDLLSISCIGCLKEPWIHSFDAAKKIRSAQSQSRQLSQTGLFSVQHLCFSTNGLGLSYLKYISPLSAENVKYSSRLQGQNPVLVCHFKPHEYTTEYLFSTDLTRIVGISEKSEGYKVDVKMDYDSNISNVIPAHFSIKKVTDKMSYDETIILHGLHRIDNAKNFFTPDLLLLKDGEKIAYYVPNGDSTSVEVKDFKSGQVSKFQPKAEDTLSVSTQPLPVNRVRSENSWLIVGIIFFLSLSVMSMIAYIYLRRRKS